MRLLLDTHTWLWAHLDPERLSAAARATIEATENALCLSPISVYEAILLAERGRIRLDPDPVEWIKSALHDLPLEQVPLTTDIAIMARTLNDYANPDPFDRFLLATAQIGSLTLVTRDRSMQEYAGVSTLW